MSAWPSGWVSGAALLAQLVPAIRQHLPELPEPAPVQPDEERFRLLDAAARKGDKARTVGLDPEALAFVERWADVRGRLGISPRRPLFCTLAGGPLDPSYVRQLLPRLARKAGVDKRVHAHGLRHTHAAELAEEGYPVNFIQDQLGHGSLATTDRYLRHVAPAARIEALRRRDRQPQAHPPWGLSRVRPPMCPASPADWHLRSPSWS